MTKGNNVTEGAPKLSRVGDSSYRLQQPVTLQNDLKNKRPNFLNTKK